MIRLPFKAFAVATVSALALAACATPTAYGPADRGVGGYSEQRVEANRYRVSFSGNSLTSREQVEMSLLLRAAELTVADGYDWFATVNRATDRDVRYTGGYDSFYRDRYWPYWGPSWRFYRRGAWSRWNDPFYDDPIREIERYEASTEIVMGRGAKPAGDPNAFDAREVISNIGGRVTRPVQ